jgi:hypothetical protein
MHMHAHIEHAHSISCLLRLVPTTCLSSAGSLQEGPKSTSDGQNDVKVVGGEKANIFRTSVKKMESSPKWNEEFQWTITSAPEVFVLHGACREHFGPVAAFCVNFRSITQEYMNKSPERAAGNILVGFDSFRTTRLDQMRWAGVTAWTFFALMTVPPHRKVTLR